MILKIRLDWNERTIILDLRVLFMKIQLFVARIWLSNQRLNTKALARVRHRHKTSPQLRGGAKAAMLASMWGQAQAAVGSMLPSPTPGQGRSGGGGGGGGPGGMAGFGSGSGIMPS
eukprot:SAG22_NODE_13252_length_412_cov_1.460064_1_plen_115_part_10